MPFRANTRAALAAVLLAGVLGLGGCAAGTADAAASPSPETSTDAAAPSESPAIDPGAEPVVPSCQNILTPDALTAFIGDGWSGEPSADPWLIAGLPVDGGIQCRWMEDHSVATDNYLSTSWGPLPSEQTDAAIAALLAEGGWLREDGEAGTYMTAEGADTMPVVDMEGYASTYLFTGDQVTFAKTKADLALIAAPDGFAP